MIFQYFLKILPYLYFTEYLYAFFIRQTLYSSLQTYIQSIGLQYDIDSRVTTLPISVRYICDLCKYSSKQFIHTVFPTPTMIMHTNIYVYMQFSSIFGPGDESWNPFLMPAGLLMYAKIIELKKHPTAILLCEILEYGVFTEQLCHYFTSRTKPSTPSHGLWLQVSIITRSSSPIILRTCHVLFGSLGLCSASWRGSNGTR